MVEFKQTGRKSPVGTGEEDMSQMKGGDWGMVVVGVVVATFSPMLGMGIVWCSISVAVAREQVMELVKKELEKKLDKPAQEVKNEVPEPSMAKSLGQAVSGLVKTKRRTSHG